MQESVAHLFLRLIQINILTLGLFTMNTGEGESKIFFDDTSSVLQMNTFGIDKIYSILQVHVCYFLSINTLTEIHSVLIGQ